PVRGALFLASALALPGVGPALPWPSWPDVPLDRAAGITPHSNPIANQFFQWTGHGLNWFRPIKTMPWGSRMAEQAPIERREVPLPGAAGGAAAIAAQLRRAILDGTYGFRERLPAERELASHFGASRSTVREALKQLEEGQLVTRRIGSGTFVNY